jgi:Mg-chelatase subunit ChlD
MEGEPLEEAKREVKKVCDDLKNSGCRLGLIQFGAAVNVVHPLTDDLDKIQKVVDPLYAGNGTPMDEGISLALKQLQDVTGNRVAIVVSDGLPNAENLARDAANRLKAAGITLYTISIGLAGAAFLQSIGDAYTQIDSASGLSEAIGNLLRRM